MEQIRVTLFLDGVFTWLLSKDWVSGGGGRGSMLHFLIVCLKFQKGTRTPELSSIFDAGAW